MKNYDKWIRCGNIINEEISASKSLCITVSLDKWINGRFNTLLWLFFQYSCSVPATHGLGERKTGAH